MIDNNTSPETKRKLAEADDTPAEILEQLSINSDRTIRALVASNPNTPMKALVKLGVDFAEEITTNPVFSLLMLENPESKFIRRCLAHSSTTSADILEKLAADSDYYLRFGIASNPITPPECLLFLAENDYRIRTKDLLSASFRLNSLEN